MIDGMLLFAFVENEHNGRTGVRPNWTYYSKNRWIYLERFAVSIEGGQKAQKIDKQLPGGNVLSVQYE